MPSTSQLTRLDSQSSRLVASPPSHDDTSYLSCSESRSMRSSPPVSIDTRFTHTFLLLVFYWCSPLTQNDDPVREKMFVVRTCAFQTRHSMRNPVVYDELSPTPLSSRQAKIMHRAIDTIHWHALLLYSWNKTNKGEISSSTTLRLESGWNQNVSCYMYLV